MKKVWKVLALIMIVSSVLVACGKSSFDSEFKKAYEQSLGSSYEAAHDEMGKTLEPVVKAIEEGKVSDSDLETYTMLQFVQIDLLKLSIDHADKETLEHLNTFRNAVAQRLNLTSN